MTGKLTISDKLALPIDAVTSTIVVYGGKGMGKTNLASVLVEEFAFNRLRFAVIDPMGVWWGLRHDVDGRGAGIEAVIFGGIHGDLPIEPAAGADVADFVADEDASVIVDISRRPDGSMWSIGERVRFVTAYAKRLYQRQGEKRRPIHQVIDEAARFAPQIVRQGESDVAACMGAIAVLVEEGRNVGIGVTLVTQRSARLNKDVAELADCMISFRIVGPNSMRAVLDWLGEHVDKARLKEIGEKIRSLPRGSALVVSPGWLEYEGIVAMRKRRTFDSSATPAPGKEVRAAGAGAKPDLAKYRDRFAKAIEIAKANDPKALKARIAELEKRVETAENRAALKAATDAASAQPQIREVPVVSEAELGRIEKLLIDAGAIIATADDASRRLTGELAGLRSAIATVRAPDRCPSCGNADPRALGSGPKPCPNVWHRDRVFVPGPNGDMPPWPPVPPMPGQVREQALRARAGLPADMRKAKAERARTDRVVPPERVRATPAKLPIGEEKTLTVLIQYPDGLHRTQIRSITGYKRSSSDSYLARLRERGFITSLAGDRVTATDAGRAALPDAEPLPVGKELQDWWLARLPAGERVVLEFLLGKGPRAIERSSIDEATGYQRSSRDSYLARLSARELVVDAGRGCVSAAPTLFGVV